MRITNVKPVGKLKCFCVSTNTGKYEINDLISHNSVAIQNVLQACLSHTNEVALGLIDIKQVEFSNYKGMKGIVGVANSTLEAVELLRVAREVMYKRNKEMAELGIKSLQEFKPREKSGKVYITGREYNEDDIIQVRIDGQEQQMTAAELVEFLKE